MQTEKTLNHQKTIIKKIKLTFTSIMDLASEIITGGTRNVAFPVEGRPDCPGYLSKGDSE